MAINGVNRVIDVNKAIVTAVKTGKVILGSKRTIDAVRTGKAKLVILASNCPPTVRGDIEYYARLSKIPVYIYQGNSIDLGETCGKVFTVAAMAIREPGDSEILKLVEESDVQD
jgi:large subunit ribosomal protein L30e